MKVVGMLLLSLVFASCKLNVPEPREREDWSDPPAQYGNTTFQGIRAPGQQSRSIIDAGTE